MSLGLEYILNQDDYILADYVELLSYDYIHDQDDYILGGYIGPVGSPVGFLFNGIPITFDRSPIKHDRGRGLVQANVKGTGAERIGRSFYAKNDLIDLTWPNLSPYDRDKILTLWDSARGMAKTFYYTDINGNVYLVRFAKPTRPAVREIAFQIFEVRVQLRVI